MRYLKLYENFEGVVKYSFSFPVYKRYEIKDDGSWTNDELCDFLRVNGVDLREDVAFKFGKDSNNVTDDDIDEFINSYGSEMSVRRSSGGWQRFKDDYTLRYEDNDLDRGDYSVLVDDFNSSKLEQYFDFDDYQGEPFELNNMVLTEPRRRGFFGVAEGTFETDRELNEGEIKHVKDYISGQCSDGWGEGFEQQNDTEDINGLKFDTSIHPWRSENWIVTIKKI